jgi:hypothetical protein
MIFSGFVRIRGCTECDYETVRPYWPAVPIAELVGIFLTMSALVWIRERVYPFPAGCPRCSGALLSKGCGFYDFGCLPSAVELLLLLLFIAAHAAIAVALATSKAP